MISFLGEVKDDQVQQLMSRLTRRCRDLRVPLSEIGESWLLSTDRRFETETNPRGQAWKDISPMTRRMKQANGQIDKILQATGVGRASINYRVDRFSLSVGTPVPYMGDFELGRNGQDQREFLPNPDANAAERDEAIEILTDWTRV